MTAALQLAPPLEPFFLVVVEPQTQTTVVFDGPGAKAAFVANLKKRAGK